MRNITRDGVFLSFRVNDEMNRQIERAADKSDRSKSSVMREAIKMWLEANRKENGK